MGEFGSCCFWGEKRDPFRFGCKLVEGQLPPLSFILIILSVFDLTFDDIAEVGGATDVIIPGCWSLYAEGRIEKSTPVSDWGKNKWVEGVDVGVLFNFVRVKKQSALTLHSGSLSIRSTCN